MLGTVHFYLIQEINTNLDLDLIVAILINVAKV